MPGSTDNLAIGYPCVGEPVTSATFSEFATDVESALSSTWAIADSALNPPAARVSRYFVTAQTINAGVVTTISFEDELYDRGSFWNPASPTLITLPVTGTYLVTTRIHRSNQAGTLTGIKSSILLAGTTIAASSDNNIISGETGTSITCAAIVHATAGQTMTITGLFAGTVTIMVEGFFDITLISTT